MKTVSKPTSILEAVSRLNSNYGRGNVIATRLFPDGRSGEFERKPTSCRPETRRFHVRGNTLFALGHQITMQNRYIG